MKRMFGFLAGFLSVALLAGVVCAGDLGASKGKSAKGCDTGCWDWPIATELCNLSGLCNCCLGEPWTAWEAFAPCAAQNSQLSMGGWTQIGYHTQGANGNGTGLFNNYPNVVQLQQAWGWVERSIDEDRCNPWDWGFRMDYVYGTDGPDTQAFGNRPNDFDNGWNNGNFYGSAIPQLYGQVAYNDLTVTMGHFFTICGYEVIPAPDNFFYSHAFTMYRAEPFTHTGVLAEYAWSDNITLWGGYTTGWDTGFTRNHGDTYLGGFSLQLLDNVAFTYTTTMGNFGFGQNGSDDSAYSHSIVMDVTLTERLNYVFQTDYVDNDLLRGVAGDGLDKAQGLNQYLIYSLSDCIGIGGRFEYFNDDALGGEVFATTLGVNVRPHENLIFRPEMRFEDWQQGAPRDDSTMFGMDMILTY